MAGNDGDPRSLQPLRPLGHLETFEAVRYARGLFSNVAMSAVYSNPTSDHELRPLILQAVAGVISQHSALSTIFADAGQECKKPYYARISQINLQDCVVFETRRLKDVDGSNSVEDADEELDQLLERYHNTRFDERWGELPLWRLVVFQHESNARSRFVASFVWQHTIGDGHTGLSFHRTFRAELSTLSVRHEIKDYENIVRSPFIMLPPSLESLHKLPLAPGYLLKMAWYDKFPSNSRALWLGAPVTTPTRSRFRSFSLTADATSRLLTACRVHSVTMTAAVHALIARAIFRNLPSDKTQLKSTIAVNLRRWLPCDALREDEMGNYVSMIYLDHKRSEPMDGMSWAEAQYIKKHLDREVKLRGKNASTACLRWAGDMHKYFASKTGRPREATFCLTNLGVFQPKGNVSGPWATERMVFSEGFDSSREAIDVTMVTGENGRLTLGLIWGDGVVDDKLMLGVFGTLKILVLATAGCT